MVDDQNEHARLERQRADLIRLLSAEQAALKWVTPISILIVAVTAGLLLAALIAGQLSIQGLFGLLILVGIFAYVVTRQFRWDGKVVSVGEIVMLLMGNDITARDDMDEVRRSLVICDAKIAQLEGPSHDPDPQFRPLGAPRVHGTAEG